MAQYRHEMERRLQEKDEEIEAIRYLKNLVNCILITF